jgi:hypothetical protein
MRRQLVKRDEEHLPDERRTGRGRDGRRSPLALRDELDADLLLASDLDVEGHARGPVTWERAVELGQAAPDHAEVEALRLTGVEPVRPGAVLEREVVDLIPLVDDVQHEMRAAIDHESIRGDVEAHHRVHERNGTTRVPPPSTRSVTVRSRPPHRAKTPSPSIAAASAIPESTSACRRCSFRFLALFGTGVLENTVTQAC